MKGARAGKMGKRNPHFFFKVWRWGWESGLYSRSAARFSGTVSKNGRQRWASEQLLWVALALSLRNLCQIQHAPDCVRAHQSYDARHHQRAVMCLQQVGQYTRNKYEQERHTRK